MTTRNTIATATFAEAYGPVAVRLIARNAGKANWEGVDSYVTCGYKSLPAARLIAYAMRDRRFSNVAIA